MPGDARVAFEKQKRALDGARAALASENLDRLLETFAPGAVHKTLGAGGWLSTPKDQLKALLQKRMAGEEEPVWLIDQRRIRVRNLSVGNVVVSEGILTGKLQSGRYVAQPVLTIAEFDLDGRVIEERLYYDMLAGRGGALANMPARVPVEIISTEAPWLISEGTQQEARNLDLVASFIASVCGGDIETVASLVTDDITYVDQSLGLEVRGNRSFCQAVSSLRRRFPGLVISPTGIWGADMYVAAETTYSGAWPETCGAFGAPTTPTTSVHSAHIFEVVGGRVAHCTAYRSLMEISGALGIPVVQGG